MTAMSIQEISLPESSHEVACLRPFTNDMHEWSWRRLVTVPIGSFPFIMIMTAVVVTPPNCVHLPKA